MISYDRLKNIIPADQALANKALQASFEQVKGISEIGTLPQFANTVSTLETNVGLNLITSQTQAVPSSVRTYLASTVATGTGPDGLLTLGDVLGVASGYRITQQLINAQANIANVNIANLTVAYTRMVGVLNGTYGNSSNIVIPSGPGQGSYSNANAAIISLSASANSIISGLTSSYANNIANINANWITLTTTLKNQLINIPKAKIDYANMLPNEFTAVKSFSDSLHSWGLQQEAGGPAEYLNAVANVNNQGGQAVVGALREGRNLRTLGNGGVGADAEIPSSSASSAAPGNMGQTNYTTNQAVANIVTS